MSAAQAVTANRLDDGVVVFFAPDGSWQEQIEASAIAHDNDAAAALLARAQQSVKRCIVVDTYLFDVVEAEGRVQALSYRERIRAQGPSIRLDLGKQAAAGA